MSKPKSLEETVRGLLSEQKAVPEKLSINIGKSKHDPTSPNASHIEEDEQLDEIMGTATGFGGRHNPRKSMAKTTLGGKDLQTRAALQRSGNQRRSPTIYEEATKKALKKVMEKKSEMALGKTATGKPGETIDTKPEQLPVSGY